MIIVTGGAGFIGSHIIKMLNAQDRDDIIVVDDLTDGTKFRNIADLNISDYIDKNDFLFQIEKDSFKKNIDVIFHEGACSTTTEWNGQFMMKNNYEYSKIVLHYCLEKQIPFNYASSAAVYGVNTAFEEIQKNECPINVYGYSKYLFDQYVRRITHDYSNLTSQVVGLRYFNVYGPREHHKGSMASVAFHFNNQLQTEGEVRLFEGIEGYANGEQKRDFIYVEDAVKVVLWFFAHPDKSGVFNVGTGKSQTFNDVAHAVIKWHGRGQIKYIPFPNHLRGSYQNFTEANLKKLRSIGCDIQFRTVEEGVRDYLDQI